MGLNKIIDLERYPISDDRFQEECRSVIDADGVLVMKNFMTRSAVAMVCAEGAEGASKAYFCNQKHNVYLTPPDENYPENHTRNREVISSKGCITDDQIPANSPLHKLYDAHEFRSFLCNVLGEKALYDYADPLSSINLHYAKTGQELGWHFDNSSFATTLMIQEPDDGGQFEYIVNMRDADKGEMNFKGVRQALDGEITPTQLSMPAGALVLFRGRNAIHRVAPVVGARTRMLVVLAYNSKPDVALSESARMTFYGRLE